jgi:molecular chaperone HtpG
METGNIDIQTQNIFPIIKKFLYSDHEIFLRELISNAVDATQKMRKLTDKGEYDGDLGDMTIQVSADKEHKTIQVSDKGIGMTAEEVKEYINQIAFSSAQEFLEKYKDEDDPSKLIGHFGLGFYSAFMVADKVEIITKSYTDAPAAKWVCKGTPEYELQEHPKEERGTDVILHLNEEETDFAETERVKHLLDKYCKFMPEPIQFDGEVINNTQPAWTKSPNDLTDDDYKNFYKELYPAAEDPLFWIHLNVDFPFHLTGILYFPKLGNQSGYEMQKNKIQLFVNQVFVTDQVDQIVPEFLMLLHGVIDSPDIPLNVSRSYLQSDKNVKKISSHITKKVADKLQELFNNDRKDFEQKWDDINVFVKYGMLSDDKFYEKAHDFCLVQSIDGTYYTFDEYKNYVKENQTNKDEKIVFVYTNSKEDQDSYIKNVKEYGYDVLKLDTVIDSHFLSQMEQKLEDVSFVRVDGDTPDKLIDKGEEKESNLTDDQQKKVKTLFEEEANDPMVTIDLKPLSENDKPVYITKPEMMRRMKDMAHLSGGNPMADMPEQYNLVVNTNHPVTQKLVGKMRNENKKKLAHQLYDLALLSQNMLKGEKLTEFVDRSVDLMKE